MTESRLPSGSGFGKMAGNMPGSEKRERNRKKGTVPFAVWIAAAAALTAADQLTKQLAVSALAGSRSIRLLPGVLELVLVENTGAAFGLGQGGQWLFVVLAALISVFLLYDLWKGSRTGLSVLRGIGETMVVAGAVGNALDRVRLGCVIDFIYVKLIDFPVFNVADICVTVGCALLILNLLTQRDEAGS